MRNNPHDPRMILAALQDSLITALIAAGSSLVAVLISYWLPERRRRAERVANLREQAAQVIEPVRNLLLDVSELKPGDRLAADSLRQRWTSELRDPLTTFGMAQGSPDVSILVLQLREVVASILRQAGTTEKPELTSAHLHYGLPKSTDPAKYAQAIIYDLRDYYQVEADIRTGTALGLLRRRKDFDPQLLSRSLSQARRQTGARTPHS
jgi:hypothetical protein